MTAASAHLRGIVIAGALAALALALGFVTLAMNQSSSNAQPHLVLPLKARHHAASLASAASKGAAHSGKPRHVAKPDPNLAAALAAGLPRAVARGLEATPVVVVQLTSATDSLAKLSAAEAETGAKLAGVAYVSVNVDHDGGAVEQLTRVLGTLPSVPATLVYQRPAKLFVTLTGFNDRTVVQQAAANATPVVATPAAAASAAGPTWATRASEVCASFMARLSAVGKPSTKSQAARFESVAADFVGAFTALKPGAAEKPRVVALNASLRREFAAQYRAYTAALNHDAAGYASNMKQALQYTVQTEGLAKQLGATGCTESSS
ncbi:MAG TPA: hypothetical protein VI408_01160 [Gaiellaceae bacterium]